MVDVVGCVVGGVVAEFPEGGGLDDGATLGGVDLGGVVGGDDGGVGPV